MNKNLQQRTKKLKLFFQSTLEYQLVINLYLHNKHKNEDFKCIY